MTLRQKIISISALILFIFASSVSATFYLEYQMDAEHDGIFTYHIPLNKLISDIDHLNFRYETTVIRTQDAAQNKDALEKALAERTSLEQRVTTAFDQAVDLMHKASLDSRNDLEDRIGFSRIEGKLNVLKDDLIPFLSVGKKFSDSVVAGTPDKDSLAHMNEYEPKLEQRISDVRYELAQLTEDSTEESSQQQKGIEAIGIVAFSIAIVLGLLTSVLLANKAVSALQRLIKHTELVKNGDLVEPLPISSKDEIGELTKTFNVMIEDLRHKEKIRDTFGKFVDPRIVAHLVDSKTGQIDSAEKKNVTVFFSDIKGFSSMSEELTASAMVNLLNSYFTTVTDVIKEQKGIIDKYIGDAVMAFWCPPFCPGEQHAAQACLAALNQRKAIEVLKKDLSDILGLRRNLPDFAVRMGLASGDVVVGTIGSPSAKSFTAIGDVVNLASRLEGVNKVYGTSILVSEDTWKLAGGKIAGREIDSIMVVGKTEPARIFEILGETGSLSPDMEKLCARFAEGLSAYRARKWAQADKDFAGCLEIKADDGPSLTFRHRIQVLAERPVPENWDGVWQMLEK